MDRPQVGLIGYGYWGPNLARNFSTNKRCALKRIVEIDPARRNKAAQSHPGVEVTADAADVLGAADIDVVVIATPVSSHFPLAQEALLQGKHVWLEKPITRTADEAARLVELASAKNRVLLVDHTFLFTSAVAKIKKVIASGELGRILYYDSVRVNLGLIQSDVNVVWDLAPHDLSVMDHVLQSRVQAISVHGARHFGRYEEMAHVSLYFEGNVMAHLHVNWLSPVKVRQTLIGGDKKMLVWNDLENEEKIRIYDKGVDFLPLEDGYQALGQYRIGDMYSPALETREALATEVNYFLDCVERGESPMNDGLAGWRVVQMLEAADRSLAARGALVEL
ncbi:MAG: Gfo/Idh/MocA family protein [Desulfovibrio aminophilus]|jgi:predicted dehydrogenase|uniref:Gfo/Idh/MocA family protein n=1 Tax=Desulfovibrio aminophilus TaxID=81425 RepID=UPI002A3AA887|nr:Gfo/Idh/MocA family oxidoreductase [Desulfovibrionaceae bacterium]